MVKKRLFMGQKYSQMSSFLAVVSDPDSPVIVIHRKCCVGFVRWKLVGNVSSDISTSSCPNFRHEKGQLYNERQEPAAIQGREKVSQQPGARVWMSQHESVKGSWFFCVEFVL